ncbi:MAG TPA: non-homologous end-joining DNA ligase [Fodinibius sp.]|nr:non-homologous end-joining DNA ligase [Fodinibius sp.]
MNKSKLVAMLPEEQQEKLTSASFPDWMEPMRATLTDDYFDDANWIYERKLDGVRCLVFNYNAGDGVILKSRNRNSLNNTYPELVEAVEEKYAGPFVADGEIVAFEGNTTSFSRLQKRINISDPEKARHTGVKVYLYLFDLMYIGGYDITQLELRSRKNVLRGGLAFEDPVRFTAHRNEQGKAFLKEACEKGWEGIIAKDGRGRYVHARSEKWLKFKCSMRQEFVIGGYTDPEGERIGFGALLLGYYESGNLQYAGQVGTGFDDEQLNRIYERLSKHERKTNPFEQDDIKDAGVHWVTPRLLAEVGFTEWTNNNKLRHPRYLGLRSDKEPNKVHREST